MKRLLIATVIAALILSSCSKKTESDFEYPEVEPPFEEKSSLASVDEDIAAFMARYSVPGASVAITKNGKLVYARGYGYADKEAFTPVDTASLFRIASLSKFTTATAIMKLVEAGKLTVNDKVFGPGGILGTTYGAQPYGQYITDITVKHLLQHTCGGWGNSVNDPMFQNTSLNVNELISWIIDNRPLTNAPGTVVDYSNVGFSILGRIVEKLSGKSYPDYMMQDIFAPAGIKNMKIAGSTLAERKTNEVKYYGQGSSNPYGYGATTIPRLDACGGWMASAIDLLRLMVRIDGFTTVTDMLQPASLEAMTTPFGTARYGFGLRISTTNNWFHGGSLTGTRTWIVRSAGGYCWCILLNYRTNDDTTFSIDLDKLVWPAVNNAGTKWPDKDLF